MIKGSVLRDALISAANSIAANRKQIDALNVFPVPDGDTGTNMSMTMESAKNDLHAMSDAARADEVAGAVSGALLWGARGNSGGILSLVFRGFAKGVAGKESLGAKEIAAALEHSVEAVYKAVMKPTEGTMLTVVREAAACAARACEATPLPDPAALWEMVVRQAEKTVEKTPDMLPVLKKAGVVDAGAKGLAIIFRAMGQVFSGGKIAVIELETEDDAGPGAFVDEHVGEILFTYCTEFIIIKTGGDSMVIRDFMEQNGDSVVMVEDDSIIKCHFHTDRPGDALQTGMEIGTLTKIKIENMREQHREQGRASTKVQAKTRFTYKPVDPSEEYGFVAISAGKGIEALFHDLGVENVVNGGQTMNPSTNDILDAIQATPTKNVIVLPNNKNIIMTAEQSVRLADRNAYVLPTKSVPQGIAAILAFDPQLPLSDNQLGMRKATERVGTGLITYAARDSSYDGQKIKKGDTLGIENGKLSIVDKDPGRAVQRLVRGMVKKDTKYLTLIYGEDISEEQAAEAEKAIQGKLPDNIELVLVNGGQPVYSYMLSVE
ncbi:MAG: DAK2 domain-containing protein [Oscillospiraceae bacterium]|nr:DAK2 domain-containing protein [Oscillospiraceae bacterium]